MVFISTIIPLLGYTGCHQLTGTSLQDRHTLRHALRLHLRCLGLQRKKHRHSGHHTWILVLDDEEDEINVPITLSVFRDKKVLDSTR